MKKILLGITCMGSEIAGCELQDARGLRTPLREVQLAQRFHHPDIDRESARKTICEQEYAIRDLVSDSGKTQKLGACLVQAELSNFLQINVSGSDHAGGPQQVGSAKTRSEEHT